jgi:hypothetical protein
VLGVLALAAPARAADSSIPVHLELKRGEECSSLRDMLAAVQKRNGRVRLAAQGEAGVTLVVRLSRRGSVLRGELRSAHGDGTVTSRFVEGSSCPAVLDALALTAALALQSELPPPSSSDARPAGAASSEPPAPAAVTPAAPREVEAASVEAASGPAAGDRAGRLRFEAGAQAAVSQPIAPHLNVGAALLVRVRLLRDTWLSPSLTVSVLHTRNELFESSRHAVLRTTGLALTACPVSLEVTRGLKLEPCWLTLGAGLQARGRDLESSEAVSRSWWGSGAVARVALSPSASLSLEVEGGALLPLVDRRFVALPSNASLGRTPSLSPLANAGVVYAL